MVDMGGSGGGVVSPLAQQYCLKWNNHQNNLLRVFIRLLGQEQFTDVTIASEGRRIKCHKDRLSSLLKTAENLKVKGLAEVSGEEKKSQPNHVTNNNYATSHNTALGNTVTPSRIPAPRLQGPPPMQMMGRSPAAASSLMSEMLTNGDSKQRKRGRPRTLDGPEDEPSFSPRIVGAQGGGGPSPMIVAPGLPREGSLSPFKHKLMPAPSQQSMSPLQAALNRPLPEPTERPTQSPPGSSPASPHPTPVKQERMDGMDIGGMMNPGGVNSEAMSALSEEKVISWGIVKMNDYLVTGTRQQYWEELFVKNVMESVKNKELDMKGAAELLGVSYGTLYGRYRENFGYLKHAWNLTGRPQKKNNLWTDPNTKSILDSMRAGNINIKQAAEALGMEPAMLAYQLAGKVCGEDGMVGGSEEDEEGVEDEDDDEMDLQEMMEVQPDIILGETDDYEDSIVEGE